MRIWRRGEISESAQWALKAVQADDTNPKAYHLLAMGLERMGHFHKALVTYEKRVRTRPRRSGASDQSGIDGLESENDRSRGEDCSSFTSPPAPIPPLGYNNLGSVQCDLGKPDVGIETLRAAIYRMPGEAILWNSLGTVLAEQGRADESLVFYNEALRLQPSFARGYHNLGYAYQHLGQLEDALANYDLALEHVIDPTERMRGAPFAQHLPDRRGQAGRRLSRIRNPQ